jgi:hypothetical protein
MPLNGYLPAELHRANYSLGMLNDCHRLGAPNEEALAKTFRALSVGCTQKLHLEEALRNLALRHAEQRAIMLSLITIPTTFHLPLNGLTQVAHALIPAKPRLSCHASTPPTAMAK